MRCRHCGTDPLDKIREAREELTRKKNVARDRKNPREERRIDALLADVELAEASDSVDEIWGTEAYPASDGYGPRPRCVELVPVRGAPPARDSNNREKEDEIPMGVCGGHVE